MSPALSPLLDEVAEAMAASAAVAAASGPPDETARRAQRIESLLSGAAATPGQA